MRLIFNKYLIKTPKVQKYKNIVKFKNANY